jgi:precorrin-2 dehydrogenase/sirohydrochlorin ferrochelatase
MFYPVFIDLQSRSTLVVGGGAVAERKVESLLGAGASVAVVSLDATPLLRKWADAGRIALSLRPFEDSDLDGRVLVISATDDPEVQKQIHAAGARRNILVNTVDIPELCDFIVPAVVRRGDVLIAVSTSGKSPALAAALRAKIEAMLPGDVARAARVLGAARDSARRRWATPEERKRAFERVIGSGILEWIQNTEDMEAEERVRRLIEEPGEAGRHR